MAQNRNLFRLTRFILLKLPYLFRLLAVFRTPRKRLLIIKADAIGDYIMFRNYIEIIKHSAKFEGYELHLLGNEIWKDLALQYDAKYISKFYFSKPNQIYYNPGVVFKLGWKLFTGNYEFVLNPNSTRNFIIDGLAGLTAAKHIIGFESDTEGMPLKYKVKTDKFYTQRLQLPSSIQFEFYRSQYFVEQVLGTAVKLRQPVIETPPVIRQGIFVFPGAGLKKRGWEAEKFAALIQLLCLHTTQTVYIAGGENETEVNNSIAQQIGATNLVNLTGKTTMPQLIAAIASAALVIANDSSAVHIAAATGTPSVCIVGGGHFGRFVPYPDDMENRPLCVYYKMPCYYCNWECIYDTAPDEAFPCIGNISVEQVWQAARLKYTFDI
ncbi:MAG: glycosyltransferase family 9 protein [Mucilaginibacter sp.]